MDVKVLRYFLAVVEEGSISGAAARMHLSQPNLSRQLSALERELGVTLMVRGNRHVELTEEGELLRRRASEIVSLVDDAVDEISGSDRVAGEIRIGGGESRGMSVVTDAAFRLRSRHPDVSFSMHSGNAEDVSDRLERGLLDFAVLIEPVDKSRYDFIRLPVRNVWGLLMREGDPLSSKPSIAPSDLKGLPLICSGQLQSWNEISGWLGSDLRGMDIAAVYNLLYNASLMVSSGLGYALCLDGIVSTGVGSGLCFRPLEPRLEVGMVLAWRKGSPPGRVQRMFLDEIRSSLDRGSLLVVRHGGALELHPECLGVPAERVRLGARHRHVGADDHRLQHLVPGGPRIDRVPGLHADAVLPADRCGRSHCAQVPRLLVQGPVPSEHGPSCVRQRYEQVRTLGKDLVHHGHEPVLSPDRGEDLVRDLPLLWIFLHGRAIGERTDNGFDGVTPTEHIPL